MGQALLFSFCRSLCRGGFFSHQALCLGFLGRNTFFSCADFSKTLCLGALLFRTLPCGEFFGCPLFGGKFGRIFHGGTRAPVYLRRGRSLHATGNKRIAERHGFSRRGGFGRRLATGLASVGGSGGHGFHAVSGAFRHIQTWRQWRFGVRVRCRLQRRFGHKLTLLVGGPHAKVTGRPFHADNAEFLVIAPLPVKTADTFGGKIGGGIKLLGPGDPIARPLKHMNFTVVNLDKAENFEQPFLVQPERGKAFGHGLAVSIAIVKFEHLG